MNFPATGGISDDAQFFFEDYNFYCNATVNSAANAQQQQQVVNSIQQNLISDSSPAPAQHSVLLAGAPETGTGPIITDNTNDLVFSTLIGSALSQDRNNNETEYAAPFEAAQVLQNGQPEQSEAQRQRNASGNTVATEERKSKGLSKSASSNKVCRVCGDKALGYNFNVVTCESCKAFFRRNALKKKKLQCPFQNRCTITVSSRRYCQKCRLRRCFEVGMKAEYIMTEEQRAQKRQRLLERETLENKGGAGAATAGSVQQDDMFLIFDNEETRNRYGSMSSMRETKPLLRSSKSSTLSSEYHQENQSSVHSPIDVAAWVNEIPAQQPITLTSPSEPASLSNIASAALENDDDMVTIRIPKSALLGILFNNNDRTQQMTALGQAVVASATSAVSSNSTAAPGGRSASCTCPCICSFGRATTGEQEKTHSASAEYPMDAEAMYGALTAESQMAYSSMGDQFSLFPIQEEHNPGNADTSQLSLAALSVADNTDNQLALCTMGSDGAGYSAAPVRSAASTEFDLDILTTISSVFDVDWQLPPPFPTFASFDSKYAKLDELLLANEEWSQYPRTVCPLKGAGAADISAADFFNLIHYALKTTIRQHSRLSAFRNLALEDQQTLIKASVPEMVTLRTIMKYDTKTEHVQVQYPGREYMPLELAKRIRGGVVNEFKQLIHSFPEKWRRNEALMLILTAVALFNPDCPRIVNKEAVETERRAYCQLLRDYLESTYGDEEANQAYDYLIESVRQLAAWVNRYSIRVVFELEPNTMEPLMVEIFDFR